MQAGDAGQRSKSTAMQVGVFSVICSASSPRQQLSTRRSLVSLSRLPRHPELFALETGGSVAAAGAVLIAVAQGRQWNRTAVPCGIRDVRGVAFPLQTFAEPSQFSALYGDFMLTHT